MMFYEAYVSEQNLLLDKSKEPVKHPLIEKFSGKKALVTLKFQINYSSPKIKHHFFKYETQMCSNI